MHRSGVAISCLVSHIRSATCIYYFCLFLGRALLNLQASPNKFMPEHFIGGFPTDGSYQGRDFGLSRLSHLWQRLNSAYLERSRLRVP